MLNPCLEKHFRLRLMCDAVVIKRQSCPAIPFCLRISDVKSTFSYVFFDCCSNTKTSGGTPAYFFI